MWSKRVPNVVDEYVQKSLLAGNPAMCCCASEVRGGGINYISQTPQLGKDHWDYGPVESVAMAHAC